MLPCTIYKATKSQEKNPLLLYAKAKIKIFVMVIHLIQLLLSKEKWQLALILTLGTQFPEVTLLILILLPHSMSKESFFTIEEIVARNAQMAQISFCWTQLGERSHEPH